MAAVHRIDGAGACAEVGRPEFDPGKAAWNGTMLAATLVAAPLLFSWSAVAVFAATTWVSLLVGHSVGMHRLMIHRSFDAPKPVERLLIWIGVLVGVSGPFGIMRIHDTRDWAQRQPACHDYFAHRCPLLHDLWWQLACRFAFERPPRFAVEAHFAADPWYRAMDATWRWHQLVVAIPLYIAGGWAWVVWGVGVRVFVSAAGHWTITHFCHGESRDRWRVDAACVQGRNRAGLGWLTYGECWHNNHHAFPESARIGLERGQADPGWLVVRALEHAGLARNVGQPRDPALRADLDELSAPPPARA
ncbi:acyl-CoA desaturase [Glacieibacterium frigidum]|uniref:Acyl-CoA desaturase n=2 Tax=Glacieibacterium frigidum TaxID=2593303 RepID=A0A552UJM4_9SPHN|nr:acyl-CoA desaturase [Glacieibacterium frigidum]